MKNGNKVLNCGLILEKISKVCLKVLAISIAVLILGAIIFVILGEGQWLVGYLTLKGGYSFVTFLFLIDYLGLVLGFLGLPIYFSSLLYIGIGQIAINTAKE